MKTKISVYVDVIEIYTLQGIMLRVNTKYSAMCLSTFTNSCLIKS